MIGRIDRIERIDSIDMTDSMNRTYIYRVDRLDGQIGKDRNILDTLDR